MVELTNKTLPCVFLDRVSKCGDQVALREKDFGIWQPVTWNQYLTHVKHFAMGLVTLGFKRGDHMAIISENCKEWLYADLACISLGGITLGVYPTSPYPEVKYVVHHSDSVIIVCEDQEQTDKILEVIDNLPLLKKIIVKDMKGMRKYPKDIIIPFKEVENLGRQLTRTSPNLFLEEVNKGKPEDVCIMIYTSGTTGPPKVPWLTTGMWRLQPGLPLRPWKLHKRTLLSPICLYAMWRNRFSVFTFPCLWETRLILPKVLLQSRTI
jgi:long-chain acyl-CoA synthetase